MFVSNCNSCISTRLIIIKIWWYYEYARVVQSKRCNCAVIYVCVCPMCKCTYRICYSFVRINYIYIYILSDDLSIASILHYSVVALILRSFVISDALVCVPVYVWFESATNKYWPQFLLTIFLFCFTIALSVPR